MFQEGGFRPLTVLTVAELQTRNNVIVDPMLVSTSTIVAGVLAGILAIVTVVAVSSIAMLLCRLVSACACVCLTITHYWPSGGDSRSIKAITFRQCKWTQMQRKYRYRLDQTVTQVFLYSGKKEAWQCKFAWSWTVWKLTILWKTLKIIIYNII